MSLASRGLRDLGEGKEQILDMEEFVRILNQAKAVFRRSLLYAAIITLILLIVP